MSDVLEAKPVYPRVGLDEPLKLSITLMTSNRKDTIRKCLDSMKHLREVVPSELVIVDTGCDDEMRSIIGEYTNLVVPFKWCNNFAAARNAGLAYCTGNWLLFIDDDEWFEDTAEIEDFFLSGDYKNYENACYRIRNYATTDGAEYADNEVLRMSQLVDDTHFHGKIHEVLLPYSDKTKHISSFIHHYGYAFDTVEERVRHSYRNIIPMREAVEQEPFDVYMKLHLALGYYNANEFCSLCELCEDTISLIEAVDNMDKPLWRIHSGLCCGHVYALCQMGFYEKAQARCDCYLNMSLTSMAQITIYRWKAYAAYKSKKNVDSMDAIMHYEELMQEFRRNPEAFYADRIHMTEMALREEDAVNMLKAAIQENVYIDLDREIARRNSYRSMLQLEQDGSDDILLARLYYVENELCRQESFCKKHMEQGTQNYAFYCLGYVDAIFSQCRYDVALKEIETALEDKRITDVDCVLLYCEGCISAFRQQDYTLAHQYGELYQQALATHGKDVNQDNIFLKASVQEHNQNRIQEIMDMLVPQSTKMVSDEMLQLASHIKKQAKLMMDAGDFAAAQSVLNQLLAITPSDEEAKHMLEKCL